MKICVITPVYAISGVPLAQLRFSRALADRGHKVDLVIGYIDPKYDFRAGHDVRLIHLNRRHVRNMFFPLVRYLRRAQPEIVFSAEDHLNAVTLLAAIVSGSDAKISCSSRVTPFDTYSNIPFTKRWVLKYFMQSVMARANALTCVARDMVDQYRRVFKSPPHTCVYNIVVTAQAERRMNEVTDEAWLVNKTEPVLIAAGTLAPWKGFADLIEAVRLVNESREVRLIILGDGPSRPELEALIRRHKLENVVKLPGFVENPLKYFHRADAFVLSSHVEGLPNVLVEAMMCGCTPVATDCPTGPREVLQDGKYGYLVPPRDPAAMARAIQSALNKPIPPENLREAVQPFTERAVVDRHFSILGLDEASWSAEHSRA